MQHATETRLANPVIHATRTARSFALAAALASLALSSCAPQVLRYPVAKGPVVNADGREATVMSFADTSCQRQLGISDEGGGAAGVVGAALIGFGVDLISNLVESGLKYLKEGRNAVWTASTSVVDLGAGVDPKNGKSLCARITRGVITPEGNTFSDCEHGNRGIFSCEPVFDTYIDLQVYEQKAAKVGDPSTLSLLATPYKLTFADTSAPVRGKGIKNVSVLIAFSSQTLAATADAAPAPSTTGASGVLRLDIGRLEVGKRYQRNLLSTISSSTAITATRRTMATAVVFESEGPDPVLEATIKAFGDNKDTLGNALKKVLAGDKK